MAFRDQSWVGGGRQGRLSGVALLSMLACSGAGGTPAAPGASSGAPPAHPPVESSAAPQTRSLRPVAPARALLEKTDIGTLIDERAVVRRYGALRLGAEGRPIVDGGGSAVESRDFLGNYVSVPVVQAGTRPRVLLSEGGVRLLVFVDAADLHSVTRVRTQVVDAAGTQGSARISLPAGAVLDLFPAGRSGPGLVRVEHRSSTCPLVVSGWIPENGAGTIYTREGHEGPYGAPSSGVRRHHVVGPTKILMEPDGRALAEFRSPPYGQDLPVRVEVVGRVTAGHRLISYRCRGVRIRGYVRESAVVESSRRLSDRPRATFGYGGSGGCRGITAASARLAPGTLLFSAGVPVAVVAQERSFLPRVRDGSTEVCVATGWGEMWFGLR